MKNPFETGSPTVDRMSRLQISGNVIPIAWYKTIRKATGKPNLNAIIILADIVYWYRPVEIRDEATGQLSGLKKRFHADLLQRSYQQIADQFGITKRDATNAVVELEKLGVVTRVFRTIKAGGQLIPNVLFLDLDVDVLEELTYPEQMETQGQTERQKGYPLNEGDGYPKKEGGVTEISETVPTENVGCVTEKSGTNTEITNKEFNRDYPTISFREAERMIREQIAYDALKHDHPYDERIDEILRILLDVMTSTAETIRVNKENRPAYGVKAQFSRIGKQHVEFVLQCMDENHTKARNIRAVLVTALYNSVNTISSYYGNLYRYHQSEGVGIGKEEETED